jgi:hypothetical protein
MKNNKQFIGEEHIKEEEQLIWKFQQQILEEEDHIVEEGLQLERV